MSRRLKKINAVKFYHTDPRSILEDVNAIPELYYLANTVMASNQRNKVSPETPLLIGYKAYAELINFYGGTSLYIPTKDELQQNLLGVMSYYYYDIKGLSWNDTIQKLGLTPTKGSRRLVRNRYKVFKDIADSHSLKVPGIAEEDQADIQLSKPPVKCEDTYIPYDVYIKVAKTVITDLNENKLLKDEDAAKAVDHCERLG